VDVASDGGEAFAERGHGLPQPVRRQRRASGGGARVDRVGATPGYPALPRGGGTRRAVARTASSRSRSKGLART
jgi:hypothetical protein